MKKLILKTVCIFGVLFSSQAYAWVQECDNYEPRDEVSFEYQRCVNDNFNRFDRVLNINFRRCDTFGGRDNIQYMNCINRNFSMSERRLNVRIDNCSNWNGGRTNYPYRLSRLFQDCVNRNFRQIDFLLRRRP